LKNASVRCELCESGFADPDMETKYIQIVAIIKKTKTMKTNTM
jgi:hypothetical protein